MVKLVNHQYNVPTTFQWVSCISILNKVFEFYLCNNYATVWDGFLISASIPSS